MPGSLPAKAELSPFGAWAHESLHTQESAGTECHQPDLPTWLSRLQKVWLGPAAALSQRLPWSLTLS